ncbi:zinc finger, CCHC-type containing protein, partial [Tanacetum coccineum]
MEKDSNTPGEEKFLRSVALLFRAFLDLHVLYKSSHTAKEMIWHATEKCTEPGPGWFLWDRKGFETIDVCFRPEVNMRADGFTRPSMIFWLRSSLSGWMSRQGYKAMAIHVMKTLNQLSVFKQNIMRDPSKEFSRDVILAQLDRLPKRVKVWREAAESKPSRRAAESTSGRVDERPSRVEKQPSPQATESTSSRVNKIPQFGTAFCSPGPDGEMYYGKLQKILEFKYLLFKVALFRVKWFDTSNIGRKVNKLVLRNNMTQIDCSREAFKDEQYILVTQVKQVFYLEDKAKPHWKVVEHVNHKKFSDGGVIVVEDDPDIIHFDNSSDLPLSTSLNDLDNATLHIDGQSTVVDAPPDIIDVPDEDDDIIGDEDALPHDLADSDVEDLINVDDDGVEKMSSADVARSHGGDGGGDDRPPSHVVPTGCGGCFANKGKGKRKPNLGGRGAGRLNTRDKTRNLSLKEIAVAKGPVPINFEQGDKQTLNPLGPHAAHWSNYIGEVVRSVPLYYPSWEKVPKERKAAIISEIG